MTDVKWVFERAIHLMDEQNEQDGATETEDTEEYKFRTLSILNVLRNELFPYSDTFEMREDGKRATPPLLTAFDQQIGLDDAIAQTVLPYGLAAHLLLGEDNGKASFFNQKYEELKFTLGAKRPAQWEDIPFSFM